MSNHKDNSDDNRFKDFLDASKHASDDSMDDFEKEALEGFAMLDSEEELLNLKAKMDKRAFEEVFIEEKKSSPIFWYAAAGLLLVIGFSVYFFLNDPSTKKNELALEHSTVLDEHQKAMKEDSKEEELAEPIEEVAEQTPVRAKKAITKSEPAKNKASRLNADEKGQSAALDDEAEVAFDMAANPVAAPPSSGEGAKALSVPPQPIISSSSTGISLNSQLSSSEDLTTNTLTAKENEIVVATEVKKQKEVFKKSSQESKGKAKESKNTPKAAEESSREASLVSSCYYTGGEDALFKDLKVLLKEKNVLLKFNATLYINENKKVERVVFTNCFEMTATDQEKIKEILKQLNKFNLNNPGSSRLLAEYQLVFIP